MTDTFDPASVVYDTTPFTTCICGLPHQLTPLASRNHRNSQEHYERMEKLINDPLWLIERLRLS